jgi:hypothetical protein
MALEGASDRRTIQGKSIMRRIRSIGCVVTAMALCGVAAGAHAAAREFWLAPPDATELNNPPGGEPIHLLLAVGPLPAVVTVDMPANGGFVPIVVSLPAYAVHRIVLSPYRNALETRPTNTVLNSGLHILASAAIDATYEVANPSNGEDWPLPGPVAAGNEFYVPLHKHAPFFNHTFASPDQAFASFDIVATHTPTTVTIYSPVAVDGHPALQQFSVTLNRGQTYSAGFTGTNYEQPSTHPAGAAVLSNFPVTVSIKDDSDQNPSGSCYDLIGGQIVPVSALGREYIAVKGALNSGADESVVVVATQSNTPIYLDGAAAPVATLFAGEYYRVDMDYLAAGPNNAVYVRAGKPVYAVHITGFGCEMASEQLPPLETAGSRAVNVVRRGVDNFQLMLIVPGVAVDGFGTNSAGVTIPAAAFLDVPGTAGMWKAARIPYNTTDFPADTAVNVVNGKGRFMLATLYGSSGNAAYYGFHSDFVEEPIFANGFESN